MDSSALREVDSSIMGPRVPTISVVLPSFRSGRAIKRAVAQLVDFFETGDMSWEVIVVDDGGHDVASAELPADPRVRLVSLRKNRGKGAAVREGMLVARGLVRVYTDADLPYGTWPFPVIAQFMLAGGFHLVIGDRTLPGAEYSARVPWLRRLASAIFSQFAGKLVTGGYFDTQCGLKGIRGDVADVMFRSARVDRFAFDVELLYMALIARLDIKRIPVRLVSNESSSVRLVRDSARMLYDVFRMKYYRVCGAYSIEALTKIVSEDFDEALHARPISADRT